jgi:hypothetical protein
MGKEEKNIPKVRDRAKMPTLEFNFKFSSLKRWVWEKIHRTPSPI